MRGVGVVVDCLIVRVDDDCVVGSFWGFGGVSGLFGVGFWWACFGLSAMFCFLWRV